MNDLAEHWVTLVQEFNSSLTRSEEQNLHQVVEEHRKQIAVPKKAAAVQKYENFSLNNDNSSNC